ncbi:octaprenyl-diphosphate synthase [Methylomarinovum caldicuralii]|uniref:Octaprenyl diphosphate synthase n=1 Tax=Methylomarinovum caldicuralii TaxID=438856 RepID=A0AAU9BQS0_9GAMM|nr:octaprenyl diphosphate synthase [Methylomarinovum caldicuralii]BCX81093.1 octaprenyl-diphosphate synthase [Methylomarinovum caldicuralii]
MTDTVSENTSASPQQTFEQVRALVADQVEAVDRLILAELSSDVVLINQIGRYIVSSGGKRLRPLLHLLAANALGYEGEDHITLAAVIEFIHTATLLHDDVVDESELRRGRDTANAVWGNAASVLVGDYLYSSAFEMMVRLQRMRVMEVMSKTTTAIAEGEVLQLLNVNNSATSEQRYLEVIWRKTAILFSAAAQLAAVIAGSDAATEEALRRYGMHLGAAFQLIDDALDYRADPDSLGKNLGDDLAEGKPTLPLIYAMQQAGADDAGLIRRSIEEGNRDAFAEVYKIVESTGAIAYTEMRARDEARNAIAALAPIAASPFKEAMVAVAEFSVQRSY